MARAGGVVQALPVAPRATPFDVDLGPDRHGGLVAVYSRCAVLRRDLTTPQVLRAGRHGCDVYTYSFALGRDGVAWLFTNSGEPEYFGAFARRGPQASEPSKAVAFAASGAVAVYIDGGPGARFDAFTQPGGTFPLKADNAVEYRRMPRSWQPLRPPHQGGSDPSVLQQIGSVPPQRGQTPLD